MIYYQDNKIAIRELRIEDCQIIANQEILQGYHITIQKYLDRINDVNCGLCCSFVALYNDEIAGYINLYLHCRNNKYRNLPEIVDFGVLQKFRNRGIGNKLMDVIEQQAKQYNDNVILAVGLHHGYGAALRIYSKRGYIFTNDGAYYGENIARPYSEVCLDDDLVLYMTKSL